MNRPSRLFIGLKALRQLGLLQLGLYSLYQLGLRSGHYQRTLTTSLASLHDYEHAPYLNIQSVLPLPDRKDLLKLLGSQIEVLYQQADEILHGKIRLFGGQPVALQLSLDEQLKYWTEYELAGQNDRDQDIKFIWEPGRFGWACTLARAYYLSKNEQYAQAFWDYTEHFITSNPPYFGPHWSSAQEVAIRIIALTFAYPFFAQSSHTSPHRKEELARLIAIHAERIPPTMVYARSQNNNHLIIEALGLYTAAALLPEHPLASRWHQLGLKWLLRSLSNQIDPDGTYIQHSTNYHRLMLQAAQWFMAIHAHTFRNDPIPKEVADRLAASVYWLWRLVDPETGQVPNLGHNDGAYILPLSICAYHDYRPVVYAACQAFLNKKLVSDGPWQEMSIWLHTASQKPADEDAYKIQSESVVNEKTHTQLPPTIHHPDHASWAMLHVASFHSRPAHADQLHLDLWWRGLNLAQDPGTYLYNAAPPWDNSLTSSLVHNTVTIDGRESMLRAGRFLYLDWAQAHVNPYKTAVENGEIGLAASHNGYRKLGIIHTRKVIVNRAGNWEIIDRLNGPPDHVHTFRLHWLLPDWQYEIHAVQAGTDFPGYQVRILSPYSWISLSIGIVTRSTFSMPSPAKEMKLIRAGKLLYGSGEVNPITGWSSPTYGKKMPALACIFTISQACPIELKSVWVLPHEA